MPVRTCESAHCSHADQELWQICHDLELPPGSLILTRDSQGPCTCTCSCLAFGTPVQTGERQYKTIESFVVGDEVLAAGRTLNDWAPRRVAYSSGTGTASRQKFAVLVTYQDTAIVVTNDHLFLVEDRTLRRADQLTTSDVLVSPHGYSVPISGVHIGDYWAGFHHIATSLDPPDENLSGRLINTNGVTSADYVVQIMTRAAEFDGGAAGYYEDSAMRPVVGSPEYVAQFGSACLETPVLPSGFAESPTGINVSSYAADDHPSGTFVSQSATSPRIPRDACSFISEEEAQIRASEPKRAFGDPQAREWTDSLINHHHAFFPDVTYHNDWADETVNAYAWVENGVRHVALKGGLLRHTAIQLEAIALVLAHELSHHYGGPPVFPGGLSCEGQADYYGVRTIMRRAWFGETYISMTDAAIQQMADFFHVPDDPTPPGGSAGCQHPPGRCRVATYHAAVNLAGKPSCAS